MTAPREAVMIKGMSNSGPRISSEVGVVALLLRRGRLGSPPC
ncbi:hypothetical protein [Amycolatopsis acidicola]|nr:hypothetical protein [Amycolatopsis acidicola]